VDLNMSSECGETISAHFREHLNWIFETDFCPEKFHACFKTVEAYDFLIEQASDI